LYGGHQKRNLETNQIIIEHLITVNFIK
jgi:hypothetical protein